MTALLSWLLEEEDPGVRYLTMRDLRATQASSEALAEARRHAHQEGKIPAILAKMNPEGFWAKAGAGYSPKYQSTVWALILLAHLGARKEEDARIATALEYYRQHAFGRFGRIVWSEKGIDTFDCLQGNMVGALLRLGMQLTELAEQIDWLARSQTGAGIAPIGDKTTEERYVRGKNAPKFCCTHNGEQPCAWGAIRVLLALGQVPEAERTENMRQAISLGVDFLLQVEPKHPKWPGDRVISPYWRKLMFPLLYQSDLLHLAEALVAVGAIADPRAQAFLDYILSKCNTAGSWNLEFSYPTLAGSFGPVGKPNKWISLRALRVLQAAGIEV
jgi:hypothetical protein